MVRLEKAADRFRPAHREHHAASAEPTPKTHPRLFTADGQRKWKPSPADADVTLNTTGEAYVDREVARPQSYRRLLGRRQLAKDKFAAALTTLDNALAVRLAPDDYVRNRAAHAHALVKLDQPKKAIESLRFLLAVKPTFTMPEDAPSGLREALKKAHQLGPLTVAPDKLIPPEDTAATGWVHNYTAAEIERRAGIKFADNVAFGAKIPALRRQIASDLKGTGKIQQLALALTIIDRFYMRVGSEPGAEHEGVLNLKQRSVILSEDPKDDSVRLRFVGKSSVDWDVTRRDAEYTRADQGLRSRR